ncbi:DapH/DapD/GlmU-related protein [Epilithonimonas vandammei]|uniref:Acyltransferase n=1 Tax=Epilithonimonas vandammei TaxID=2487072 RepID=A0A3G8ZH30_9FLAO|nr:DapH/DapD/GlmU-related protein [Epilithonimonas vandammei]AZI56563.1 acyltransferase [Epilithonimonas vandammei]
MKKSLFKFSFLVGRGLSFFLYKIIKKIEYVLNNFYSGWISRQFNKVGSDPTISYPIDLIGGNYIYIGDHFTSGKRLRLNAYDRFKDVFYKPLIILGNNININDDCHIACIEKIEIGNNVLIAGKVFISDHLHGDTFYDTLKIAPSDRNLITKGGVFIEDDVWIGENVSILPGVRIGKGSVIGANSVVTKNIPKYSIAVGSPARCIKEYSEKDLSI